MGLNPYEGLIQPAGRMELACDQCFSKRVAPENCVKCHGARGFSYFCPKCESDCGCEEWQ